MAIHQHPVLRSLEEALESNGLIKTLDSLGITVLAAAENVSRPAKVIPVAFTRVIRGTAYTAA